MVLLYPGFVEKSTNKCVSHLFGAFERGEKDFKCNGYSGLWLTGALSGLAFADKLSFCHLRSLASARAKGPIEPRAAIPVRPGLALPARVLPSGVPAARGLESEFLHTHETEFNTDVDRSQLLDVSPFGQFRSTHRWPGIYTIRV